MAEGVRFGGECGDIGIELARGGLSPFPSDLDVDGAGVGACVGSSAISAGVGL